MTSTKTSDVPGVVSDAIVRLSSADLLTIQHAIECRIKSLEELRWRAVAMGATDPLYRNISLEIEKNRKAESASARYSRRSLSRTVRISHAHGNNLYGH